MTMEAKCPQCGSEYDIEQDEVGRMARCEICGNRFVIEASRFRRNIAFLFSFSGRIWRREYLKALAVVAIIVAALLVVSIVVGVTVNLKMFLSVVLPWFLAAPMFCILAAPVSIRRLHDINISGIWYLLFVGLAFTPVLGYVCCIIVFAILSCTRGTPGNNDYDIIPRISPSRTSPHQVTNSANHTNIGNRREWQWVHLSHYGTWIVLIMAILKLTAMNHKHHIKSGYNSSWCPCCMIRQQRSDTSRQNAEPVFSEVRDLEDVVIPNGDCIRNNCLYRYSGCDLKIRQVITSIFFPEYNGVLVTHKEDWNCQDIFIRMNTDNLVDGEPLPSVTVKYDGIFRFTSAAGAERSVRAFKVVKKYKIIPR